MDWTLLFPARSILCKKSYSNNCFSLGASTNIMEFFLFWSADTCIFVPIRLILLFF